MGSREQLSVMCEPEGWPWWWVSLAPLKLCRGHPAPLWDPPCFHHRFSAHWWIAGPQIHSFAPSGKAFVLKFPTRENSNSGGKEETEGSRSYSWPRAARSRAGVCPLVGWGSGRSRRGGEEGAQRDGPGPLLWSVSCCFTYISVDQWSWIFSPIFTSYLYFFFV